MKNIFIKLSINKKEFLYILGIFSLLSFLFFSKNFLTAFPGGDFLVYWYPHYPFILKSLKAGYLPLWNPYSVLGIPELFKAEMGFFYPPLTLSIIFNYIFNPSINLNIVGKSLEIINYLHIFIGMYGTFLFSRKVLKLNFIAAIFGGLVYAFSPFGLSGFLSLIPSIGNMLFPMLMYSCYIYLEDTKNIKKYLFLIFLNFCIFTLGDPYLYLYYAIAQGLMALICFDFKSFFPLGIAYINSLLLAGILMLPNFYMLTQSYRSGGVSNGFSQAYSFFPTRIIAMFDPLIYTDYLVNSDKNTLFSWSFLAFGALPLIMIVVGLSNFINKKVNIFLIALLVFGGLYMLNAFSGLPELLSNVLSYIRNFRSHPKIVPWVMFALSCFASQGLYWLMQSKKLTLKLEYAIPIFIGSIMLATFIIVPVCPNCLQDNSQLILNIYRGLIFLGIYYMLIKIYNKTDNKQLIVIAIIVFILEMHYFYTKIPALDFKTSYKKYFGKNSLIYDNPNKDELFRYSFEENQFQYGTLSLNNTFSNNGYESAALKPYYTIGRLGFMKTMEYSNVKYLISIRQNLDKTYPGLKYIKDTGPLEKPKETFISSIPNYPYWTNESTNTHYIYEVKNFIPRFFVPKKVISCKKTDCISSENPPEIVISKDIKKDLDNVFSENGNIRIKAYTPNKIELEINTSNPTFIASSEILSKGWEIKINNESSRFYDVSDGFRGFIVPTGNSTIIMNYVPPYIATGIVCTILGILGILLKRKLN